jgi:hypothetical protein
MAEMTFKGLVADPSIFVSPETLSAFLEILSVEKTKQVALPSEFYRDMVEGEHTRMSEFIAKWQRKKAYVGWIGDFQKHFERFVSCDEIMKSNLFGERWKMLPEKLQSQIGIVLKGSKDNVLKSAMAEMLVVSFIMGYPMVAFSRQFQRQLRRLEVPTLDSLVACTKQLKMLHKKKKYWHNRLEALNKGIRGHKVPFGKIILVLVGLAVGLASWQVVSIILFSDFPAVSELVKEVLEGAVGISLGALTIDGI